MHLTSILCSCCDWGLCCFPGRSTYKFAPCAEEPEEMTEVLCSEYSREGISSRGFSVKEEVVKSPGEGKGLASEKKCDYYHGLPSKDGGDDTMEAQLSMLALLLATFRCKSPQDDLRNIDIGCPTNVRHVTHVTFDCISGFHGLPVEFQTEIPQRVPSASASIFGVSLESMQCSYDGKGNSVPTILLLLQERLYDQGGLRAEGIFRINAENSQEQFVRDQLNKGIVPENIDVHCLAGLIKAWLRELPRGVLDSIPPEQLLECQTEQQYLSLVRRVPPMQAALLDWAVNLMTDVAQEEEANKMNARNIAMVFAPNMTQMSDPLTALMHAVKVMNFLKTLILKTMGDRRKRQSGYNPASDGLGLPTNDWNERQLIAVKGKEEGGYGSVLKGGERVVPTVEQRFMRGNSGRGI